MIFFFRWSESRGKCGEWCDLRRRISAVCGGFRRRQQFQVLVLCTNVVLIFFMILGLIRFYLFLLYFFWNFVRILMYFLLIEWFLVRWWDFVVVVGHCEHLGEIIICCSSQRLRNLSYSWRFLCEFSELYTVWIVALLV